MPIKRYSVFGFDADMQPDLDGEWVKYEDVKLVFFGHYICQRCGNGYMVNDQWKECTPDFCHDCYAHLKAQYALVPVGKDGKDVPQ